MAASSIESLDSIKLSLTLIIEQKRFLKFFLRHNQFQFKLNWFTNFLKSKTASLQFSLSLCPNKRCFVATCLLIFRVKYLNFFVLCASNSGCVCKWGEKSFFIKSTQFCEILQSFWLSFFLGNNNRLLAIEIEQWKERWKRKRFSASNLYFRKTIFSFKPLNPKSRNVSQDELSALMIGVENFPI